MVVLLKFKLWTGKGKLCNSNLYSIALLSYNLDGKDTFKGKNIAGFCQFIEESSSSYCPSIQGGKLEKYLNFVL
jgi:hypothetical protein